MNRLSVGCGALIVSVLFGCSGKGEQHANTTGGSGGNGASAGEVGVKGGNGGAGSGGEAGELVGGNAGEGGEGPVDSAQLGTSAWDVTIAAKYEQESDADPTPIAWSLAVDDASELKGLLSRDGQVKNLTLKRDGTSRAHLEASAAGIRLQVFGQSPLTTFVLNTLALTAFDDDGDDIADRLEGNGKGTLETTMGDVIHGKLASFSLSGKLDRTPPKLNFAAAGVVVVSPLVPVGLTLSEAMKSAELTLDGTSTLPLTASDESVHSSFSSPTVLPFTGAWQVTGHGDDFAGLALGTAGATYKTIDDPGVFVQDGFETEPFVARSTDVAWIEASGGLPIPTASHALLIPRGDNATFHLKRIDGNTKVSVRLVGLRKDANSSRPMFDVQSAVIGGTKRVKSQSSFEEVALPTSHTTWTLASAPQTVQLDLEDAGTDVVVQVSAPLCSDWIGCSPNGALLIDDLHLE